MRKPMCFPDCHPRPSDAQAARVLTQFPSTTTTTVVMAGLVPATHHLLAAWVFMGGRHKPGRDDVFLKLRQIGYTHGA
jgi:hypothetical protein